MRTGLLALTLLIFACSSDDDSSDDNNNTPDSGTADTGTPDSGDNRTPEQRACDDACALLIGCGVQYDASCSSGCLQAPVFRGCAMEGNNITDCNALALCAFRQGAALACAPGEGIPGGSSTCNQVATCEYNCGAINAPASCSCDCWEALDPAKAINLLINNQCTQARCPVECNPTTGNGPACNTCFLNNCQDKNAQCVAN